jgi:glyoxylase-like metal-dependent hydrolase (beta-lactamase superfamily II)
MIQMQTAIRERKARSGKGAFLLRNMRLISVAPDIACIQNIAVNLYFVGHARSGEDWALIDTGLPYSAENILRAAEERFGPKARPRAIFLTHGHFDHVGGVRDLAEFWDVPVFAHEFELPYLTGLSPYPPPDPNVGGGLLAWISGLYPRAPINLGRHVHALQQNDLPFLDDWCWIHTPGHTPGHVSFFRQADRVLLAGDAFTTTRQESLTAVLTQHRGVYGPPAYFTSDWGSAWASVQRLASLHPLVAAAGHGLPMRGTELEEGLQKLARDFDRLAVPHRGRYVLQPAVSDKAGVVYLPPRPVNPMLVGAIGLAGAAGAIGIYYAVRRHRDRKTAKLVRRLAAPVIRTKARNAADRPSAV